MPTLPEYRSWSQMRQRCCNPRNPAFGRYGGRGITICKEWKSFKKFLADMGPRPSIDHTLDRIDNNGNYEPKNCRWATWREQQNNRRNNKTITFQGKTMTIRGWADQYGLTYATIFLRLQHGYTIHEALTRPQLIRKSRLKP